MAEAPTIVLFRRDLRVSDNPALDSAIRRGAGVLPVFVWSTGEHGEWRPGKAQRWWLRRSLEHLQSDFAALGSRLLVQKGSTVRVLKRLVQKTGARRVVWNRHYEPEAVAMEKRIQEAIRPLGAEVETFEGRLLGSGFILNQSGSPFQRFTPFCKAFLARVDVPQPLKRPRSIPTVENFEAFESQQALASIDSTPASEEPWGRWKPGSGGGHRIMNAFRRHGLERYAQMRDRLDLPGTSLLSPHLSFGEVSAREAWHRASGAGKGATAFRRQLVWREFAYHQLAQFPQIVDSSLRPEFEFMPSVVHSKRLRAWSTGRTGYPIVDAGMRQLRATGWMHNRVRMVAASFLTKHLGLAWQVGAHAFWDRLVDADLANNSMNWQWVAGSAVDAAPYYRIFNPVRQGERFDPEGRYVRTWIPELRSVSSRFIHTPWKAPEAGAEYREPIVDHAAARRAAMERYASVRQRKGAR